MPLIELHQRGRKIAQKGAPNLKFPEMIFVSGLGQPAFPPCSLACMHSTRFACQLPGLLSHVATGYKEQNWKKRKERKCNYCQFTYFFYLSFLSPLTFIHPSLNFNNFSSRNFDCGGGLQGSRPVCLFGPRGGLPRCRSHGYRNPFIHYQRCLRQCHILAIPR